MKTLRWQLTLIALACFCAASHAQQAGSLVAPRSVRTLMADGKHNAFTSLVKWRGDYWLSFRKGSKHNSSDADVIVMRSPDAENWKEAFRLDILPDDRGGHFVATEKRLFLYVGAMKGDKLTTFLLHTDDGQTWTKPEPVYEPQFIVWKPFLHNGRFYANAHRKAEGKEAGKIRESRLITSTDGVKWETVATVRKGNWESETTFYFGPKENLTAFLRTKYSVPGSILEAMPPYRKWTEKPAGVHLSGHGIHTFRGVTYLLSRTMEGKKTGTMVYTFEDGELRPYCALPSGGDCSYAEAVEVGDEMLVSYYSSHEGTANIYLARVPLKDADVFAPAVAKVKLQPSAHLVFVGDSLTALYPDHNYVAKLRGWLASRFGGKVHVTNAGIGGDYITRLQARLEKDVLKLEPKPTHVFIFLGHNDSKLKSTSDYKEPVVKPEDFDRQYREVVSTIRKTLRAKVIILSATSSVYEITKATAEKSAKAGKAHNLFGKPEALEQFNAIARKIAAD
ncbi:MAG: hypothetical protein FJ388_18450, partial [Verrucomicrobia bacterium]|nr:hypothetical protein [Verrucomicrobiota bacterium]